MIHERDRHMDGQMDRHHMTAKAVLDASIAWQENYHIFVEENVCNWMKNSIVGFNITVDTLYK